MLRYLDRDEVADLDENWVGAPCIQEASPDRDRPGKAILRLIARRDLPIILEPSPHESRPKMINRPLARLFLISVWAATNCTASDGLQLSGLDTGIEIPSRFNLNSSEVAKDRPDTRCLEILYKNRINVGLLCSSTDRGLLADLGVFASNGDKLGHGSLGDQGLSIRVATGASSYEMAPVINSRDARIYAAQVDCDQGSGAVYRATSTCHVTVFFLSGGGFLYSNVVLENHTNRKKYFTEDEIHALLDSIGTQRLLP